MNETGVEFSLKRGSGRKCLTARGQTHLTPSVCLPPHALCVLAFICMCACVFVWVLVTSVSILFPPGLYTITPVSCHRFEMEEYGFDT